MFGKIIGIALAILVGFIFFLFNPNLWWELLLIVKNI